MLFQKRFRFFLLGDTYGFHTLSLIDPTPLKTTRTLAVVISRRNAAALHTAFETGCSIFARTTCALINILTLWFAKSTTCVPMGTLAHEKSNRNVAAFVSAVGALSSVLARTRRAFVHIGTCRYVQSTALVTKTALALEVSDTNIAALGCAVEALSSILART